MILLGGVAILVAVVVIATAGNSGSGEPPPSAEYVALGDSYTAAPSLDEQISFDTPPGCLQSNANYPHLVASHNGVSSLTDVSCAGALATDVKSSQQTADGVNAPQQDALSAQTGLVTVGLGGNDAKILAELLKCATAAAAAPKPCLTNLVGASRDQLRGEVLAARPRIDDMLSTVTEKAPSAKVFVVGYPQITPNNGTDCPAVLPLTAGDLTYFDSAVQLLNTQLRESAAEHKAIYVDTYKPSIGLNACAASDKRWIEPFKSVLPTAPMHPNPRGQKGFADAVSEAIDKHLRASTAKQ